MKIKIAELDINTDALIKATADVKKEIDKLKESQKQLTKNGETSSKLFVQNAADLKVLQKAYNGNIKALAENTQATAEQAQRTELLSLALGQEATSIKEAREQNKLLNKLRNEATTTLGEQSQEVKDLNAKLNENNEFIKANADNYLQQKINVGNYKDSITEALGELNLFNGGIGGFISRSQEAGGTGKLLSNSLGAAAKGFLGMTKAALGFIATPVGAVLALVVLGFALIKNAMNRSEESTKKITGIFKVFGSITNKLLSFLEPLGNFLIDGLVVGFESVGKVANKTMDLLSQGLSFLGFEDAAKGVSDFSNEMNEAAAAGNKLAKAEAELTNAQRESRRVQLEYQKDAEKLRQIRDDESKSFAERQKANEELGASLKQQQNEEIKLASAALKVAELRLQIEGETTDNLDARAEALTELTDINERIAGQESEQLTNRISLQREANDKAIEQQKGLLDLFIAEQGIKAKTLEEEVVLAEQLAAKKLEILKAELNNKKITREQFAAAEVNIQNEVLRAQQTAAVDNAQRELEAYTLQNQSKLDADKFYSEESLRIEQERFNSLAEKQKENEAIKLEQGVINQTEYNAAIDLINEENRLKNEEAQLARDEAQKEADAIDLENKQILDEEKFNTQFELDMERERIRFEAEKEAAIKSGADLELIDKKHANNKEKINEALQESKIASLGATLGQVSEILGKESDAGKAAALAQALINTYQGITAGVKLGYPAAIPAVASATLTGFGAVKKIVSTKSKFEKGGLQEIGGRRHSAGGTTFKGEDGTTFEAEKGELIGVMNRNAAAHFMAFNDSFPNGNSTPTFFQGGGVISQGVSAESLNTNELAQATADAVSKLPPPVVFVDDINTGQINTAEVVSGADL